jgi:hypothetical protein
VDALVSADKADLEGELLRLRGSGLAVRLAPASHFRSVAGGGADRLDLLGRVKGQDAIASMGGEAYMTSVLFGETAYDVEPGYLALPVGAATGLAEAFGAATGSGVAPGAAAG